jgi:hypothetical protein
MVRLPQGGGNVWIILGCGKFYDYPRVGEMFGLSRAEGMFLLPREMFGLFQGERNVRFIPGSGKCSDYLSLRVRVIAPRVEKMFGLPQGVANVPITSGWGKCSDYPMVGGNVLITPWWGK